MFHNIRRWGLIAPFHSLTGAFTHKNLFIENIENSRCPDLQPPEAGAGDEACCDAGDPRQQLAVAQHRLAAQAVQQQQRGEVCGDLHEDGEAVVQVEVGGQRGGRRGQAVVAHRGHHPVQEHDAGPAHKAA